MPEVRPAAMLPRPWPMSSWLPSKRSPRMPASCLPMASDSTAPSRAMASAGMNRSRMEAMSKAGGRERGGTTLGMAPTRRTPCSWRPSRAETAEMMTRAARVAGKRREMRLKSRISRMVPPETSRHQMLRCVKLWMACSIWGKNPCAWEEGRPSAVLSWPDAMSRAAPAEKATMTEWEMKLASSPRRARPMPTWMRPQSRAMPKM